MPLAMKCGAYGGVGHVKSNRLCPSQQGKQRKRLGPALRMRRFEGQSVSDGTLSAALALLTLAYHVPGTKKVVKVAKQQKAVVQLDRSRFACAAPLARATYSGSALQA
jgi:hypothetical protein